MNWTKITKLEDLEEIKNISQKEFAIIFKHSTGCGASKMSLSRFEKSWKDEETKNIHPYFLDLLAYREISDKIAKDFGVRHESPQLLLIKYGKCIYNASHHILDYEELLNHIA
jgi:bacillithiol system protein YtxJ